MEQEMSMMFKREVWVLVPKTEGMKVVGNRWVFNLKRDHKGQNIYKARLVAQGFLQKYGETYDEVFSPVVNFAIIRFFFSIFVSLFKWEHFQLDVKSAYLYANLDCELYMWQPQGFVDKDKPEYVCKIQKAIYGLHQSGRQWFLEIDKKLRSLGFKSLQWVNCVYTYNTDLILLLYVDDIVLMGRNMKIIEDVLKVIRSNFEVKELGKTQKLLGVMFEGQNLVIKQEHYINKIYDIYSKQFNVPIASLPVSKGTLISKTQSPTTDDEQSVMKEIPYRSLIGALSFVASRTRPDIAYVVNRLSQMQSNPAMSHWECLLKVLGYLKATCSEGLDLSRTSDLALMGYSDASYADNLIDRTSTSGYIIFMGGSPVSWRTAKQSFVTLSTMESEYVALTDAAKEVTWLTRVLKECSDRGLVTKNVPVPVLKCDNQAAICMVNSPIENARTKHIDVRLHFIRDLINDQVFKLVFVKSKENMADIFTKAPTKHDLETFKSKVLHIAGQIVK